LEHRIIDKVVGASAIGVQNSNVGTRRWSEQFGSQGEALGFVREQRLCRSHAHRAPPSRSSITNRAVAFAEFTTPGTPAPGCVPAPTRYRPGILSSRLWGRNQAL